MGILAMLISLVVLTFPHRSMMARDIPEPIGRKQAIVPLLPGVAALPLSLLSTFVCVGGRIRGRASQARSRLSFPFRRVRQRRGRRRYPGGVWGARP